MFENMSPKLMNAIAILLFIIVFLVLCFYTFIKCLVHRRIQRRINAYLQSISLTHSPLDQTVIEKFPKFVYSLRTRESPLENCSICLSKFEEGDEVRVLPKCGHVYHVECIDTWFRARSSCPICRGPVLPLDPVVSVIPPIENTEAGSSSLSSTVRFPTETCERKSVELAGITVEIEATRPDPVIA